MSVKTRYLQVSDTTMLEFCMLEEPRAKTYSNFEIANAPLNTSTFILTKLIDKHYAVFSPASAEVEYDNTSKSYKKKKQGDLDSINTINHLAIPKTGENSYWYTFLDSDYEYVTPNNLNNLDVNDWKVREYAKYCKNPFPGNGDSDNPFLHCKVKQVADVPGWDTLKVYFVSGYDFSDIYAGLIRLFVKRNDGSFLDLCNFFYSKSNVYKYIKYMSKPIIFGNYIYDKYLEINVVSIAGLDDNTVLETPVVDTENNITYRTLKEILNINNTANIRLSFSFIDADNKELDNISASVNELATLNITNRLVNCEFVRSSSINGSIPTQNIQSDNLGVYIAVNPDYPYIEFYGTWKNMPLDFETVQGFNSKIELYDKSLVHKEPTYIIEDGYVPEYDMKKWVALHEIECLILNTNNEIVKNETYSLSQTFINQEDEIVKFYYRPIYFDEIIEDYNTTELTLVLHYTLRFMNIEDSVQFIKKGSLTVTGEEINRFWGKGAKLPFADTLSYKVYNKITENKQSVKSNNNISTQTRFVKVFYNVSEIGLDANGSIVGNGNYTLIISKAPRNYKFIFKQKDINNNYKYVDLTDSYYKLYAKDKNNNDIIIEPTFSANMNLVLGELEFNINTTNINKLYEVPQANRYISIVAYNTDGSISSLYDMRYTF